MRLIWIYQFGSDGELLFNDEFMINSNDGYYWAKGTDDILTQTDFLRSPTSSAISILSSFFVRNLPFSIETVMFYMSSFFASLIVIPIVLIGKHLYNLQFGFISALFSSIAISYYNRTLLGYYDTDMLNIVFPMFLLWSTILALNTKEDKYFIFTAFEIILYRWWYPQSYSLEFSFLIMIFLYIIIKLIKRECVLYELKLLSIMLFSMLNLSEFIKSVGVIIIYLINKTTYKTLYMYCLMLIVFAIFITTGGINPILGQLENYVFDDTNYMVHGNFNLSYYSTMQTNKEATDLSFLAFTERISGSLYIFILSLIGYLVLMFKHKFFLLSLPFVGLGYLGLDSGLRFTIYAVPILGMGIGYLIVILSEFINKKKSRFMELSLSSIFCIMVLLPNINHIFKYNAKSVLSNSEVSALIKVKNISHKNDYIVSWWDYGYPLAFYTGLMNITDGAKHSGADNYIVSYILTQAQKDSAQMLRLVVEFDQKKRTNYIENMMTYYEYSDIDIFLNKLKNGVTLPKKTRDIYLYLPTKMLSIYPTIERFSNINLTTGNPIRKSFIYQTDNYIENNEFIDLGKNIHVDIKNGTISINNKKTFLKRFVKTFYDKNDVFKTEVKSIDNKASLSLIFMESQRKMILLDERNYNSTFIKLAILGNYNKKLFSIIIDEPTIKIYKIKL